MFRRVEKGLEGENGVNGVWFRLQTIFRKRSWAGKLW